MEPPSVSVTDFQDYHNHSAIVEDTEDGLLSSPIASNEHPLQAIADDPECLSDSAHGHSSSADDEAVFDRPVSRNSSPGTSQDSSDEEISILESVSAYSPSRHVSNAPHTPSKSHSPFHHPSSVRAMQLDTTPPHLATPSSQRKRFHTPSRQSSTPRSTRSGHRSTPSRLMNSSPVKTVKREHPLVLLHITLLPLPQNYDLELLESVCSPAIFANWKLLLERTNPTVLHRGVLIPHPKDDYDVLEDRLLQSLELKQSRILKCGHFHLSPEEEADVEISEDEEDEDLADADICEDCGRRVRDGRFGDAGSGSKRWDIKVFAANGLMGAGAWSAAWKEMERVDVLIHPWMEETMKHELEVRSKEAEILRREQELSRKEEGIAGLDDERLREIYGQDASIRGTPAKERTQDDVDGLNYGTPSIRHAGSELPRSPSQSPFKFESTERKRSEVPLWELLRNYVYLAAQDPRNILIWVLSAIILFFAFRSSEPKSALTASPTFETSSYVAPPAMSTPTTSTVEDIFERLTNSVSSVAATSSTVASALDTTESSTISAEPTVEDLKDEHVPGEANDKDSSQAGMSGEDVGELLED